MKITPQNSEQLVNAASDIFGGREKFLEAAKKELDETDDRWNQNVEVIGRILRAHLFLEHYLTKYLSQANPRLGSLTEAKLSFHQKISLLDSHNQDIASILPGIKRLNAIRNRLAHNLGSQVTEEDKKVFLDCGRFAAMRSERSITEAIEESPLGVLEDFAKHTHIVFTYEFSPISKAINIAIDKVQDGVEI